jgi:hypothetical protein
LVVQKEGREGKIWKQVFDNERGQGEDGGLRSREEEGVF